MEKHKIISAIHRVVFIVIIVTSHQQTILVNSFPSLISTQYTQYNNNNDNKLKELRVLPSSQSTSLNIHIPSSSSSSSLSSLQSSQTEPSGTEFDDKNNEKDVTILQTRGAIMEHALQIKSSELETMTRRNTLLQDVVKKLQVSNRNLLDKIHELQHEKEGMHISTDSPEELWPPEMEMSVQREEFNSKEMEWQNALETAHWKYSKLRDDYYNVNIKLQETIQNLEDKKEQIVYLEEKGKLDEIEFNKLRDDIEEKENLLLLESATTSSSTSSSDGDQAEGSSTSSSTAVVELEEIVTELQEQNNIAKKYIQDLIETSKQKRESIQNIVMKEKEKNEKIVEDLKSTRVVNIQLETELETVMNQLKLLQTERSKEADEAIIIHKKKEKEWTAKMMFSKESLDIATAAVRQAESRERNLRKKITKKNRKLDKTKEENLKMSQEIEEMKSSIEEEMEQYDRNMELLAIENDWKLQVNDLATKLQEAKDFRDVLCRQELRLRQSFDDSKERHKLQMETHQTNWEEKFQTQKMECSSLAHELKTEIMALNDTILSQEIQIKGLGKERDSLKLVVEKNSLKLAAVSPIVAPDISMDDNSTNNSQSVREEFSNSCSEDNGPKRFRKVRTQFRKLKKWLRD